MEKFNNLKLKKIRKGSVLLYKGNVCENAYKVLKGCLRSYVLDQAGKEHILQFAPEGWLISDLNSFINGLPATLNIDAIEDSEVLIFEKSSLHEFEKLSTDELKEQIKILTKNVIAINKRLSLLLASSSKERYLDFVETYSEMVKRIPLKMIASYIGVTPEYLSDIRKKLTNK